MNTRMSALLLLLACLPLGCEEAPSTTDRQLLDLAKPASRSLPADAALVTTTVWGLDQHPWSRFKPGSWVVFELPGPVWERHLLQRTSSGTLEIVLQIRTEDRAADDWGTELLRQAVATDGWPEMERLAPSARVQRQTHRVAGFQLEVEVLTAANQTIWLSSHVPGGIVQIQETVGKDADVVRRKMVAFGVN